jgi:hypothetical protein
VKRKGKISRKKIAKNKNENEIGMKGNRRCEYEISKYKN